MKYPSSSSFATPARFDDWALGVKQVNPLAYYWTRVFVVLAFSGPVVATWDRTWPLPLPLLLGTIFALFGMLRVGREYDGIVKAMGLPHAVGIGVATAMTARWVFVEKMVPYNQSPISYGWACVTLPFCSVMTMIDVWDIFEWFVLRTRKVTRSEETVCGYVKRGLLPQGTKNEQWLMKRGVVVNELCNEFGFLK